MVLTAILSRHSLGNVTENLVRRAVRQPCVLERIDAEAIAGSQQDYLVADRNAGNASYVDQRQIHGDAADDGRVVIPHDYAAAI